MPLSLKQFHELSWNDVTVTVQGGLHPWYSLAVNDRPAEILLVEDNPADVRLTEEALKEIRVVNKLHVLPNGEEALSFLYRRGAYGSAPRPDFVLLDWNLPKVDGSEVLELIRKDKELNTIPVIVLTGSREQTDVIMAYHLKADAYITKPVDASGFMTILECCPGLGISLVVNS